MERCKSHQHSYLCTGQAHCYGTDGHEIPCSGSGQDGEYQHGLSSPVPRFDINGDTVCDTLTGLIWTRNANLNEYPLTWNEALAFIQKLNITKTCGFDDWRLPNRHELRSLVSHQTRNPALPEEHPFNNVFLGWYWTSTSAAIHPSHAWYIHMQGARMFFGGKDQSYLVWPVRGRSIVLTMTGQRTCYDEQGNVIPCKGTGQDGELFYGRAWPQPRFTTDEQRVSDLLTGLVWYRDAGLAIKPVTWQGAFETIANLNKKQNQQKWRLPNINELESLIDCDRHTPALPANHPFKNAREAYWSSTTSAFEPDWAWALYLHKGAVGVGQKKDPHFFVWPVADPVE
ncbi:MAG: hypothetical protein BMS9Abin36_0820 [Gammaproteobacteria bacterium]|nr:MAG: hypothetical protein BMS9Abin36_0820 [Gammaproteobacteria bacterium]